MKSSILTYTKAGVDYESIDPLKRLAQKAALETGTNSEIHEISQSRGESAYVWEEKDCYRAIVIEGLGTKNLVADTMRKITGKTYYDTVAQDTVAMIVNDLLVVGARPQVVNAYFAVGSSDWFKDTKRTTDLVNGWAKACKLAGAVWGGGETPTLSKIISPEKIDLAGAAIGIIKPKKHLALGDKLSAGDVIILIESNGIHANGLTLVRAVASKQKQGFNTKLDDGTTFGETILKPTCIYANVITDLFDAGIAIHYQVNITGHGWRKLMRAQKPFTYVIEKVPETQTLFSFIQEKTQITDQEMYATFNMGAGFAVFVDPAHSDSAIEIIKKRKFNACIAGYVEKGKKQIIILHKNIVYCSETLRIR